MSIDEIRYMTDETLAAEIDRVKVDGAPAAYGEALLIERSKRLAFYRECQRIRRMEQGLPRV